MPCHALAEAEICSLHLCNRDALALCKVKQLDVEAPPPEVLRWE